MLAASINESECSCEQAAECAGERGRGPEETDTELQFVRLVPAAQIEDDCGQDAALCETEEESIGPEALLVDDDPLECGDDAPRRDEDR